MNSLTSQIKRTYKNNVLQMRLRAGYAKQKEFADRIGICSSIVCDIESNRRFLSSAYGLRIAEVLNCSINDLFIKREAK
jgi:DNA-binding XRE family transcriptional regulator